MHCTHAELAPMPLFTWFQPVCLNRVLWSRIVREGRVVDVLGVQPGVRVRHLGVGLAAWLAQYIPRTAHLLHRHSYTPPISHHTHHSTPHPHSASNSCFFAKTPITLFALSKSLILDVADIVTMPASPKVLVSTTQQATISSRRVIPSRKHHQTVYDDGRSQYIVERRRRSDTVLGANTIDSRHRISSRVSQRATMTSSEHLLSSSSRSYPSSKDSAVSGNLASRDGLSKKSNTSRAVVITTGTSNIAEKNLASETWASLTPPPTPRMKRLPTPELSELDETSFCYCDDPTTQVYCRSCRKQIGSSAGGF
jgi:hypothetical protein